jgi:hypothetical protein
MPSAAATPLRRAVITAELLRSRPALRPGEVLEFVPGVIVTQHSGDGKANQYFLRGFNLDHGTDFATTRQRHAGEHAHAWPWPGLHRPELPAARTGAAHRLPQGAVLRRQRRLLFGRARPTSSTARGWTRPSPASRWARTATGAASAGSGEVAPGMSLLGAVELMRNDGPWTVPEDLQRSNAVSR